MAAMAPAMIRGHPGTVSNGLGLVSGGGGGGGVPSRGSRSDCEAMMMVADLSSATSPEFNNNQVSPTPAPLPPEELALLAKLEEANRLIESDSKSLHSFSNNSGHSRKSSDTSQISLTSGTSSSQDHGITEGEETDLDIWGRIVNDFDHYSKKKSNILKELVRKGIPDVWRNMSWQLLCGALDSPLKQQYAEYIKATSVCEKVIRRDIARTYPEHDFFKEKDGLGQGSLFNVMKAYSLHDREVGYCQGSGFIVGLLLMHMPEEETFAVFVKIMQNYRMRDMFKPSMAELGLCMFQLENLVQELLPELFIHFQSQNFHTSMYASSWFLTLFTTAFATPTANRVIDVFLLEGMEIIFKIALALLQVNEQDLLALDMEGMLKFFQKTLPSRADSNLDELMEIAYNIKISSKKMKKLEKEYVIMKKKEQEEMVELKRLRNENKLLKQRVELLENESTELADRLVRGQVSRAEEEETTFVVQRELAALKHTHLETSHRLELAQEEIRNLSLMIEQNNTSCQSSLEEVTAKRELLTQKEDMIHCLQAELVKVRLREAENEVLIRDLRDRIQELEEDKKRLRETVVDNSVAHLQEELIAVKLREAEANLSLKELRQRVTELNMQWQKHLQERKLDPPPPPDSTPKKIGQLIGWNSQETQKLEEELMTSRLREMEAVSELKELRLKVMELETQVQVSGNQLRRQDEDNKRLKEEIENLESQQKELHSKLREQQHRYSDLESKMKDDQMMARIRDAEHTQLVAELTQKISRLELQNEEMVAEGELRGNADDSDKVHDLQNKVADLKAEIARLENWKERWTGNQHQAVKEKRSASIESEHDELSELRLKLNADSTPVS